jgi:hypothetical protein
MTSNPDTLEGRQSRWVGLFKGYCVTALASMAELRFSGFDRMLTVFLA